MELKKNPSKDIHRRYPLHFVAGLCISCGLIIIAFELNFKKEPDVYYQPPDWDHAVALVDPNFLVERPATEIKKHATPLKVVRTVIPTTIEIATEPTTETEVILQGDPFVEVVQPAAAPSVPAISDEVFIYAEEMPEPIDGFTRFYKQIAREVHYPRAAAHRQIEGKVFVEFVVDRQGNPTFVKVIRGIGYGCDEEAAKALAKTKWKPGRQRGVPVRVRLIMPITFSLTR